MQSTEQQYKDHIKELEQQIRLLKEHVDFLPRKLYGTKSEKASIKDLKAPESSLCIGFAFFWKTCHNLWGNISPHGKGKIKDENFNDKTR